MGTSSGNTSSPMPKLDNNLLRTMRQELRERLLGVRPCEPPDEVCKRAHSIQLGVACSVLVDASEDNIEDLIGELETDDVDGFADPAQHCFFLLASGLLVATTLFRKGLEECYTSVEERYNPIYPCNEWHFKGK